MLKYKFSCLCHEILFLQFFSSRNSSRRNKANHFPPLCLPHSPLNHFVSLPLWFSEFLHFFLLSLSVFDDVLSAARASKPQQPWSLFKVIQNLSPLSRNSWFNDTKARRWKTLTGDHQVIKSFRTSKYYVRKTNSRFHAFHVWKIYDLSLSCRKP